MLKDPRFLGPRAAFLLVCFLFIFFLSGTLRPEFYDASADEIDYNLPSLNLSVDTTTISLTATPQSKIVSGRINTSVTSEYVGYNLYTYFGSTNFTSEDGNSSIPAITSATSSLPNNSWAYKVNNTGDFRVPVADETHKTRIASDKSPHPSPVVNYIDIHINTIGSKADTYSNSAYFTLESNPSNYTVSYFENKPSGVTASVSGMPNPLTYTESISASPRTLTLSTSTPTLDGYTFCGWGKRPSVTCSDNEDIITSVPLDTSKPSANVYAVWEEYTPPVTPTNLRELANAGGAMQNITPGICAATPTATTSGNNQYMLTDSRDNKTYYVAKLRDGKCWMTQNLDLELSTSRTLTAGDSDFISSSRATWTPSRSTQNYIYTSSAGVVHTDATWQDGTRIPYSYRPESDPDVGTSFTFPGKYVGENYRPTISAFSKDGKLATTWKNMNDCMNSGYSSEICSHWRVGTMYSWFAANASTKVAGIGVSSEDSICPRGWRLPTLSDYSSLVSGLSADAIVAAPYYLIRGGSYYPNPGVVTDADYSSLNYNRAYYWTSTSYANSRDINTLASSPNMSVGYAAEQYSGGSIRCVARSASELPPSRTVTIAKNADYGTVSTSSIIVPHGTSVSFDGSTLIMDSNSITSTPYPETAQYSYAFSGWTNGCGSNVMSNCTITANFSRTTREYTITWNGNGGSTPDTTTLAYGSQLGTLPTPTYTGYNFLGWFTAASGGTQISSTTTVSGDTTYYAHWEVDICAGQPKMQDISTIKNTLSQDAQTQLCDARDGKTYWVAKLKDGNVWMTQNLDLNLSNSVPLTDKTTDLNSKSTWTPPHSTDTNLTTNRSYCDNLAGYTGCNDTFSWDAGDYYWTAKTWDFYDMVTVENIASSESYKNGYLSASAPATYGTHFHLGNYYQWNTVTAGSGASAVANENATDSICPAGWRLPINGDASTNYSYSRIISLYNISLLADSKGVANSPLYLFPAGSIGHTYLSCPGMFGNYTTSTRGSNGLSIYNFSIISSYSRINDLTSPVDGLTVRCVSR